MEQESVLLSSLKSHSKVKSTPKQEKQLFQLEDNQLFDDKEKKTDYYPCCTHTQTTQELALTSFCLSLTLDSSIRWYKIFDDFLKCTSNKCWYENKPWRSFHNTHHCLPTSSNILSAICMKKKWCKKKYESLLICSFFLVSNKDDRRLEAKSHFRFSCKIW